MTDVVTPGSEVLSGTPAAPAGDAPVDQPAADAPWYAAFKNEEARGFAETRGWKDPEQVVESFRNLEKLVGKKTSAIDLPSPDAPDDAWQEVWNKMGRPEKPDAYKVPDAFKDDAMAKAFLPVAHQLGYTSKQLEGALSFVGQATQQEQERIATELARQGEADMVELRNEWAGVEYDKNIEHGRRAMKMFGIDTETVQKMETALGTKATLKLLANIGGGMGEHSIKGGTADDGRPSGFGKSPEAARVELAELQKDGEFTKRYLNGDTEAKKRMESLYRIAYGEAG